MLSCSPTLVRFGGPGAPVVNGVVTDDADGHTLMFRVPSMGSSFLDTVPPDLHSPDPVADSEAQLARAWSSANTSAALGASAAQVPREEAEASVERTWADLHAHSVGVPPEARDYWPRLDPVVHAAETGRPGTSTDAGRRSVQLYVSVDAGVTFSAIGHRFTFFSQTMLVQGNTTLREHSARRLHLSHRESLAWCQPSRRRVPRFVSPPRWHTAAHLWRWNARRRPVCRGSRALWQAAAPTRSIVAFDCAPTDRAHQRR